MRFRLTLMCVLAVLLSTGLPVISQVATGMYAHGAFDPRGFDTINIGNLNTHFSIPVFSKSGRGGMNFVFNLTYDGSIWTPVGTSGSQSWVPSGTWGWAADTSALTGYFSFSSATRKCFDTPPGWYWSTVQNNFQYTDQAGVLHGFSNGSNASTNVSDCSTYGNTNVTINAADGSGLVLEASLNSYQIRFPNGKIITPPLNSVSGSASAIDSNGNEITTTASSFTDTTGTTVLSLSGSGTPSSPRLFTYPTYLSTGASSAYVTVHYASQNVHTAFGCSGISEYTGTSLSFVDYVQLADGQQYQFAYEPTPGSGYSGYITGRLQTITLPGGGRISYAYSGGSNGIVCEDGGFATLTRSMPDDPAASSWTYARTPASGVPTSHTDVTDNMSPVNHAQYDFIYDTTDVNRFMYVTNHKQFQGPTTGPVLVSEGTCYNGATPSCTTQSLTLPITAISVISSLDGASTKETDQTFNSYGLLTTQTDYDYGPSSHGGQVHATAITYASLGGIIDLPDTVAEKGGQTSAMKTTAYTYDGVTLTSTSGLPQHISMSGSRGNLTSASVALSTSASIQTLSAAYDDAGQLRSSTDVNSKSTTYTYDSGTDTFPTGISLPTTGSVTHSASATFDVPTGLMLTSVDQNGNTITYTYDPMLRSASVSVPNSTTSFGSLFSYSLASTSPYITSGRLHSGTTYVNSTKHLDGYGRITEVETTDTPSNDLVYYTYDADGRLNTVSNPYRTGDTPVYTQTGYDAIGRTLSVTDTDGSSRSTTYSGNAAVILDEASNQHKVIVDALGQTIEVLEPDGSNSLTLETDYQYDQNQTSGSGSPETYQTIVTQKGGSSSSSAWRVRTFTYDTLGRLLTSAIPEAGTTTFTYPVSGSYCAGDLTLPCTRTDANTTKTTYYYDELSRLYSKTYTGTSSPGTTIASSTSAVSYYYDQTSYNGLTIVNGKGFRTGMSDGSGATAWTYDTAGNVQAINKTIATVTKPASLTHNPDHTVAGITDFGGTAFSLAYNSAGRNTEISDATYVYAGAGTYNAAGHNEYIAQYAVGTSPNSGHETYMSYNSRLQPIDTTHNYTGYWAGEIYYTYGASGANNGQIDHIGIGSFARGTIEDYTYDQLGRLYRASDGVSWGQIYTYDNWGNLYDTSRIGSTGGHSWSATADVHNHLSTQTYDAAGEMTVDEASHVFSYDAEGRLITAGTGSYVYDGDGNRVKKTVGSTSTLYWPLLGAISDESNSAGTSFYKQIQFAGRRVYGESPLYGGLLLFTDHLGSIRATWDLYGYPWDDIDYLPFGSFFYNYAGWFGATPTDNHYTFTGDESDQSESGTDYAHNRNLSTQTGRFNRPDSYYGSYVANRPQTLNRYSYAQNNPIKLTDRNGMYCYYGDESPEEQTLSSNFDYNSSEDECGATEGAWQNDSYTHWDPDTGQMVDDINRPGLFTMPGRINESDDPITRLDSDNNPYVSVSGQTAPIDLRSAPPAFLIPFQTVQLPLLDPIYGYGGPVVSAAPPPRQTSRSDILKMCGIAAMVSASGVPGPGPSSLQLDSEDNSGATLAQKEKQTNWSRDGSRFQGTSNFTRTYAATDVDAVDFANGVGAILGEAQAYATCVNSMSGGG